jgi:hypothetical protein
LTFGYVYLSTWLQSSSDGIKAIASFGWLSCSDLMLIAVAAWTPWAPATDAQTHIFLLATWFCFLIGGLSPVPTTPEHPRKIRNSVQQIFSVAF